MACPEIVNLASHQTLAAIRVSPGLFVVAVQMPSVQQALVLSLKLCFLSSKHISFPSWVPMSVKNKVKSLIFYQVKGLLSTLSTI